MMSWLTDGPPDYLGVWCNRIKTQLDERKVDHDYFSNFRKLLSKVQDGISERTELIQFLEDMLHNENLFHEDGSRIKLGDNAYRYSSLRKQLYLSLFAMIGGVYDSSARLCYHALNRNDPSIYNCSIHNIFFPTKDCDKKITNGHMDIIGPLKTEYGYFLGVIIFLRNLFVHRGESILGERPFFLFQSNNCSDLDLLNPEVLDKIGIEAHNYYKVKKYSNQEPHLSTFNGKTLIELVNTYLLYADHAIGLLINSLLGKHVGLV